MSSELLKGLLGKEVRALSKLISMAENRDESVNAILESVYADTGRASVLGITGPPGAGKSTLIGELIRRIRAEGKTVAVLAVDPVSPFSGGAVLGDRIRLTEHFNDAGVFIRSFSTRGKLGGLSGAAREALDLVDAFGFDWIILETVGVGQSEVTVRNLVDLTLLVLVPEWGDGIQALKAGILEIGDLFVVGKADREGADRIEMELKNLLQMTNRAGLPVHRISHTDSESISSLYKTISGLASKVRGKRKKQEQGAAAEMLKDLMIGEVDRWLSQQKLETGNPYEAVGRFRRQHPRGFLAKE